MSKFKDYSAAILMGTGIGLLCLSIFIAFHSSGRLEPSNLSRLQNLKGYVVLSGSMEPAIKTGSVVLVSPKSSYATSDIVTFKSEFGNNLTTHRITEAKAFGSQTIYQTKGDANEEADLSELYSDQIVGKVILTIPFLGYAVDYAKTPQGFLVFVVIPATIIIYEELKSLGKQLLRANHSYPNPNYALKMLLIIPVVGVSFLLVAFTNAFLKDVEKAAANIFSASDTFVTPIPTPTPEPPQPEISINEETLPS